MPLLLLCLGFMHETEQRVSLSESHFFYFTWWSADPAFLSWKKKKNLTPLIFHGWVILHCIHIPHSLYPLTHWWAPRPISWLLVIVNGVIMNVTVLLSPDPWFLAESKSEEILQNGHACYPLPPLGPWFYFCPCMIALSPFLSFFVSTKALIFQSFTTKSKLHSPCPQRPRTPKLPARS